LLYGHVDVVTTLGQDWTYPPFEGKLVDGYVWGRGALDMKSAVTMLLTAFIRAKAEGLTPAGDVVLAILSDEEAGGDYGAKYLVENHAEQFQGIRYALGEFGGFTLYFGKRKFYPIQVTEKQLCWMKVTIRGPGGHGSIPMRGGAMAKMADVLQKLDRGRLPAHVTPVVRQMIETIASALPFPANRLMPLLFKQSMAGRVLPLLGTRGQLFEPMLHNTVNATIVQGGVQINVVPSEIVLQLDGRLLPGYGPEEFISELRHLIGDDVELEVIRYDSVSAEIDMGLFDTLAGILREGDPDGIPMPLLVAAVTDGRFFSRLGIQTYGFTPMKLPAGFIFQEFIHAADERIPVEALSFGVDAVYKVLQQYGHE
jgi:acetylornithine deacetylase/succinyl-diaminopimelate desuccinylase-like protein